VGTPFKINGGGVRMSTQLANQGTVSVKFLPSAFYFKRVRFYIPTAVVKNNDAHIFKNAGSVIFLTPKKIVWYFFRRTRYFVRSFRFFYGEITFFSAGRRCFLPDKVFSNRLHIS
jgi:hypothetical protein